MSENIQRILEGTFTAVFLFLILTNANGFSQAVYAIGTNATKYVSTLQGK